MAQPAHRNLPVQCRSELIGNAYNYKSISIMHNSSNPARSTALLAILGVAICGLAQAQTAALKLSPVMYYFGSTPTGTLVADSNGRLFGAIQSATYAPGGLFYRLEADRGSIPTIYQYGRLAASVSDWTGANPSAGPLLARDGNLYGVTQYNAIDTLRGATVGAGTIFRMSVNGENYTKLDDFQDFTLDSRDYVINNTGLDPQAALIDGLENGVLYLYGTTLRGGLDGTGTIFKVRADGAGDLVVLHHFAAAKLTTTQAVVNGVPQLLRNGQPRMEFDVSPEGEIINADGANPNQRLLLGADGKLYGTTRIGGPNGTGVIFRVNVDGTDFRYMPFDASPPNIVDDNNPDTPADPNLGLIKTNRTGAYPQGGLVQANGLIYGTAATHGGLDALNATGYGGNYGFGIVFSIDPANFPVAPLLSTDPPPANSAIQPLLKFTGPEGAAPGEFPSGDLLIANDGLIVGTTRGRGIASVTNGVAAGSVYKLSLDGATLTQQCIFTVADGATKGAYPTTGVVQSAADTAFYGVVSQGGPSGTGVIFKCGATDHTGPVLGVPPPYDDGSGSMPWWLIAGLAAMLAVQSVRRMQRV